MKTATIPGRYQKELTRKVQWSAGITADYYGGTIKYGKIIAKLKDDELEMLYQCLTTENELKAGKAIAKISLSDSGKIKLSLNWEWLTNGNEKGISEYIEVEKISLRHKV